MLPVLRYSSVPGVGICCSVSIRAILVGPFPGKAKAVNLPYHRGGFLVNDKVFVLVHEVAIDGLACDGLSAHALRAFYCLDFLARISHQPFVKNVPQRGKIIFPLCAVHSVIDSDEATPFCGKIISVYIPTCK